MKRVCRKIRSTLSAGGPAALRGDDHSQEHLAECDGCFEFLEALVKLENTFSEMLPLDAPDHVVEELLAHPEVQEACSTRPAPSTLRSNQLIKRLTAALESVRSARIRWGVVAMPAVVLIGLLSIFTFRSAVKDMPLGADLNSSTSAELQYSEDFEADTEVVIGGKADEFRQGAGTLSEVEESDLGDGRSNAPMKIRQDETMLREAKKESLNRLTLDGLGSLGDVSGDAPASVAALEPPARSVKKAKEKILNNELADSDVRFSGSTRSQSKDQLPAARISGEIEIIAEAPAVDTAQVNATVIFQRDESNVDDKAVTGRRRYSSVDLKRALSKNARIEEEMVTEPVLTAGVAGGFAREISIDTGIAEFFLEKRKNLNNLVFKDDHGYWANTYVPGDRELRSLKARIESQARTLDKGAALIGLHQTSHQTSQPFDSPDKSALAVYVQADSRGVEARERLRVQIGIKGTNRRAGLRPPMNVGLVLDLRGEVPESTISAMRALVEAFAAAADLGDRFSLTIAGRVGGCIVPPSNFRHGPLSVALREIFTEQNTHSDGLNLLEAVTKATETVRAEDDPTAPLGSSVVILITDQGLGMQGALIHAAHESGVDGVPISAIGIGSSVDLNELDQLVLAGQGNRRILESGHEAQSLVARELRAVSRVIARAVRLRIELAPGVQLVDILGSHSLDEARAQRVRDAENAIDQRLSRNLGIIGDRGLDDSGIQIVIPSFYANDSHVILLDVVVPGPGPVADVSVRYKDLVHMNNGVAQAQLTIGRDRRNPGPLELNVLKNQLAYELGLCLAEAADLLAAGRPVEAVAGLEEYYELLVQLPGLIDGLANDRDLEGDRLMLENYIQELASLQSGARSQLLTDSMHYAGRLKVLSLPLGEDH